MKTFNEIYSEYYNNILNFISFRINSKEDAEEITQDVFVKINNNLVDYDESLAKISTWIYTIAKNAVIDHYRLVKKETVSIFTNNVDEDTDGLDYRVYSEVSTNQNPYVEMVRRELSTKMLRTFKKLPKKVKRVANLYYNHQYKMKEISEVTGMPLNTVKTRVKHAREFFKNEINS